MPAAEMHMFIYVHFFTTRELQRADKRAESKKCIHYIYTKYPFSILKKCIHYIYTWNHISSQQQSFQRPRHYSYIPQPAGSSQKQTKPLLFHPTFCRHITQQSQATTMQPLQYIKKRYTLTPPQAYTYFFAHFSRFLQNGRQGAYIRP